MTDSVAAGTLGLSLSQPVITGDWIQFSAYGLGWGFSSYSLPASLAIRQLGAADTSRQQLNLAFQVNRQRIAQAVADAKVPEAGKRAMLLTV